MQPCASGSANSNSNDLLRAGKARDTLQVKRASGSPTTGAEQGATDNDTETPSATSAVDVNSDDDHLTLSLLLETGTCRKSRKVEKDTTTRRYDKKLREERTRQEPVWQASERLTRYEGDTPTAGKGQYGNANSRDEKAESNEDRVAHGHGVRSEKRGQEVLRGEKHDRNTSSVGSNDGKTTEGRGSPKVRRKGEDYEASHATDAPEQAKSQGSKPKTKLQGDTEEARRKAKRRKRRSEGT